MNHLETLLFEYYDWQGYLVKSNIKVGRLSHGGYKGELDIVAYNPHTNHLIHLEPSIDANNWETREQRFTKKFASGKQFIFSEVFTWLDPQTPLEQVAILISHPKDRHALAASRILSIDELMLEIKEKIIQNGIASQNAIPEQYPLLRTIQLTLNGYYRALPNST